MRRWLDRMTVALVPGLIVSVGIVGGMELHADRRVAAGEPARPPPRSAGCCRPSCGPWFVGFVPGRPGEVRGHETPRAPPADGGRDRAIEAARRPERSKNPGKIVRPRFDIASSVPEIGSLGRGLEARFRIAGPSTLSKKSRSSCPVFVRDLPSSWGQLAATEALHKAHHHGRTLMDAGPDASIDRREGTRICSIASRGSCWLPICPRSSSSSWPSAWSRCSRRRWEGRPPGPPAGASMSRSKCPSGPRAESTAGDRPGNDQGPRAGLNVRRSNRLPDSSRSPTARRLPPVAGPHR